MAKSKRSLKRRKKIKRVNGKVIIKDSIIRIREKTQEVINADKIIENPNIALEKRQKLRDKYYDNGVLKSQYFKTKSKYS